MKNKNFFIILNIIISILVIVFAIVAFNVKGMGYLLLTLTATGILWLISYLGWYLEKKAKDEKSYFIKNFTSVIKDNSEFQEAVKETTIHWKNGREKYNDSRNQGL